MHPSYLVLRLRPADAPPTLRSSLTPAQLRRSPPDSCRPHGRCQLCSLPLQGCSEPPFQTALRCWLRAKVPFHRKRQRLEFRRSEHLLVSLRHVLRRRRRRGQRVTRDGGGAGLGGDEIQGSSAHLHHTWQLLHCSIPHVRWYLYLINVTLPSALGRSRTSPVDV